MFVRQKKNKSGVISIQVIDKSSGKYKVLKTIGSSSIPSEIKTLLEKGKDYINKRIGYRELDFSNTDEIILSVLNNITSHKLAGIELILG